MIKALCDPQSLIRRSLSHILIKERKTHFDGGGGCQVRWIFFSLLVVCCRRHFFSHQISKPKFSVCFIFINFELSFLHLFPIHGVMIISPHVSNPIHADPYIHVVLFHSICCRPK